MAIARAAMHGFTATAASSATVAKALTGIPAGALIVVDVSVDNSVTITTVRDDLTVDGVLAAASSINYVAHGQRFETWYFENHGGGDRTFTATFSASAPFRSIEVTVYTGVALTSSYFDGSTNTGNGAVLSSGAKTPPVDGCLIHGAGHQDTGTQNADTGAGYAEIDEELGVNDVSWEDKVQGTAASVAATWTGAGGFDWVATMAIFTPAAGGPSVGGGWSLYRPYTLGAAIPALVSGGGLFYYWRRKRQGNPDR